MFDAIIIGAGAAGLMCAREAALRRRTVLVLEGNRTIGEKIRISGGGRCNFTNLNASPDYFLSSNPGFCTSALARYKPSDFIALLEQHRIAYHEKKDGQLFCDGSAQQIIDLFRKELGDLGAAIETGTTIDEVGKNGHFHVRTAGREYESGKLVVATGGLSIPSLGATDLGYSIAKVFGLNVLSPRPGLVPLLLSGEELTFSRGLSGVSMNVRATCATHEVQEEILFTHRGVSGPAILQLSSVWEEGRDIIVDLLPGIDICAMIEQHRQTRKEIRSVLGDYLPKRFADAWCTSRAIGGMVQEHTKTAIRAMAEQLHHWNLHPTGTEGFGKAEVTVGGVDTKELSSKTMEANGTPGIHFIGEVVDVTGRLGGFNFQWAWASGAAAGRSI